jgi:subtilisin family serine protease
MFRALGLLPGVLLIVGSACDPSDTVDRLVPDDYESNAVQFDVVRFPEAWAYMEGRWQWDRPNISRAWPEIVVIDDGFFATDDSTVRPEIRPGYPDGTGDYPNGSAWGDLPPSGRVASYGHHGTAVLSLLASRSDNSLLIAGVCGPLDGEDGTRQRAGFLPVRIGRGITPPPTPAILEEIFREIVLGQPTRRLVNLSKTLVDVDQPDGGDLEVLIRTAGQEQVVIVTGAGNSRGSVAADRWIRRFDNVIVVGALNRDGTDYWVADQNTGTATGPGVDLYAPGEDLTVIEALRSTKVTGGTSMAAPLVTGVAAMILNLDPQLDPVEVRDILVDTADVIRPRSGGPEIRRLNAFKAVRRADPSPP